MIRPKNATLPSPRHFLCITFLLTAVFGCKARQAELKNEQASFGGYTDEELRMFDEIAPKCSYLSVGQVVSKETALLEWIKVDEMRLLMEKFEKMENPEPWNETPLIWRSKSKENPDQEIVAISEFDVEFGIQNPDNPADRAMPLTIRIDYENAISAAPLVRNFLAQANTGFYQDLKVRQVDTKNGSVIGFNLLHRDSDDDPELINPDSLMTHTSDETSQDEESPPEAFEDAEPVRESSALANAERQPDRSATFATEDRLGTPRSSYRKPLYSLTSHGATDGAANYASGTKARLTTGDVFTISANINTQRLFATSLIGSGFGIYLGDSVTLDSVDVNDLFVFGKISDRESLKTLVRLRQALTEDNETRITHTHPARSVNTRNPANVECFRTNAHKYCQDSVYSFAMTAMHGAIQLNRFAGSFETRLEKNSFPSFIEGTQSCRPPVSSEVLQQSSTLLDTFAQKLARTALIAGAGLKELQNFAKEALANYAQNPPNATADAAENTPQPLTSSLKLKEFSIYDKKFFRSAQIANPSHLERLSEIVTALSEASSPIDSDTQQLISGALQIQRELLAAHRRVLYWFSFAGHGKDWPTTGKYNEYTFKNDPMPVSENFLTILNKMGNNQLAVLAHKVMYKTVKQAVNEDKLIILNKFVRSGRNASTSYGLNPHLAVWFTTKEYRKILSMLVPEVPLPMVSRELSSLLSINPFQQVPILHSYKTVKEAATAYKPVWNYLANEHVQRTLYFALDDLRIEAKAYGQQDPLGDWNARRSQRTRGVQVAKPSATELRYDSRDWRLQKIAGDLSTEAQLLARYAQVLNTLGEKLKEQ